VSSDGSGAPVLLKSYNRKSNVEHFALPNVWAPEKIKRKLHQRRINYNRVLQFRVEPDKQYLPDRATKSVLLLRPTLVKLSLSWSRVKKGAGREAFAAARLAVVLSLLPNGTVQLGPPACNHAWLGN
jgi:hypothetical protein